MNQLFGGDRLGTALAVGKGVSDGKHGNGELLVVVGHRSPVVPSPLGGIRYEGSHVIASLIVRRVKVLAPGSHRRVLECWVSVAHGFLLGQQRSGDWVWVGQGY